MSDLVTSDAKPRSRLPSLRPSIQAAALPRTDPSLLQRPLSHGRLQSQAAAQARSPADPSRPRRVVRLAMIAAKSCGCTSFASGPLTRACWPAAARKATRPYRSPASAVLIALRRSAGGLVPKISSYGTCTRGRRVLYALRSSVGLETLLAIDRARNGGRRLDGSGGVFRFILPCFVPQGFPAR